MSVRAIVLQASGPERPRDHPQPRAGGRVGDRRGPRPGRARAAVATTRRLASWPTRSPPRRRSSTTSSRSGRGAGREPPVLFATHDEALVDDRAARGGARRRRAVPWSPWARWSRSWTRATSTPSRAVDRLPGAGHGRARRGGRRGAAAARELRFPVVLKPRNAPEFRRRFRAQVLEAANADELRRAWDAGAPSTARRSPEVIPGEDALPLDARQLPRRRGRRRWPRSPGASCASGRRASGRPAPLSRTGTPISPPAATPARRPGLPRHLAGGGQARRPRWARLPDRGQPPLVAVDRPGDRVRGQPAAGVPCSTPSAPPSPAHRSGTEAACAGRSAIKHVAGSAREIRGGTWSARSLRAHHASADRGRRARSARPAAGASRASPVCVRRG